MDLGINGIWLMPVMPSVTYHKYDTTDYENIDPQYGTLETFQELLTACHDRGIRVIPVSYTHLIKGKMKYACFEE